MKQIFIALLLIVNVSFSQERSEFTDVNEMIATTISAVSISAVTKGKPSEKGISGYYVELKKMFPSMTITREQNRNYILAVYERRVRYVKEKGGFDVEGFHKYLVAEFKETFKKHREGKLPSKAYNDPMFSIWIKKEVKSGGDTHTDSTDAPSE